MTIYVAVEFVVCEDEKSFDPFSSTHKHCLRVRPQSKAKAARTSKGFLFPRGLDLCVVRLLLLYCSIFFESIFCFRSACFVTSGVIKPEGILYLCCGFQSSIHSHSSLSCVTAPYRCPDSSFIKSSKYKSSFFALPIIPGTGTALTCLQHARLWSTKPCKMEGKEVEHLDR